MEKQEWATPTLTIHGDVEKLTLNGGQPNADLPHGPDNTAYSPH
jgi:hypothetical protein